MINNILNNFKNLFKTSNEIPKQLISYKTKIKFQLCYIEGEFNPKYSLPKYTMTTKVESEDSEVFQKAINKVYSEYGELIKDVNKQLKDSSCDYIQLKNQLLIKKKDFVNAVITSEDHNI